MPKDSIRNSPTTDPTVEFTCSNKLLFKVRAAHIYVVERLAENLCENLCRQYDQFTYCPFDAVAYMTICKDFFSRMGFETSYVNRLYREIAILGYKHYFTYVTTGFRAQHFASGIHPEVLVCKEANDLVILLNYLNNGYHQAQVEKWNQIMNTNLEDK